MARRWRWITADIGIAADLPSFEMMDDLARQGFELHDLLARSGLGGGGGPSPANDTAERSRQRPDLLAPKRILFCEWIRQRGKPHRE